MVAAASVIARSSIAYAETVGAAAAASAIVPTNAATERTIPRAANRRIKASIMVVSRPLRACVRASRCNKRAIKLLVPATKRCAFAASDRNERTARRKR